MNWNEYINKFEGIINGDTTCPPYNDKTKVETVKLNYSRMKRWLKQGEISNVVRNVITSIQSQQKWILITEPWCGDAAHVAPFIQKITALNPQIDLIIQLRDEPNSEIDLYLTNGSRAMPKLIVRDKTDTDLFVWGPRTQDLLDFVNKQKSEGMNPDEMKIEQQNWYNQNKGISLQLELVEELQKLKLTPTPTLG